MRLTVADKNNFYGYYPKENDYDVACQKLGQLEDIEDELDIDLITLFKALKQDYVYKKKENEYIDDNKVCVRGIGLDGLIVYDEGYWWGDCDYTLSWKDYGETWALTKEELE